MKLNKLLATGLAVTLLITPCMSALAAPSQAKGLTTEQVNSLILNVEAYKQAYPDLAAAFGSNATAYIDHYLTNGIYEGRTKGALFNPLIYVAAYNDIRNVFGNDIDALVSHYVRFGVAEKRTMGTSHGYADIAAAQSSGLASAYILKSSAAGYQNISYSNDSDAAGRTANATSGTGNAAERWDYSRKNLIYHNDEKTLWRVEYYDENNNLKQYSNVTNVDLTTNSYTENVYSYDEVNQVQILERVDTYANGELVSSTTGSN